MGQPIQLDNGSTLPPLSWASDSSFPNDDKFGYVNHDLSFVVDRLWIEFPYLRRIEDFPYPHIKKCNVALGSQDHLRRNQDLACTMEFQATKSVTSELLHLG